MSTLPVELVNEPNTVGGSTGSGSQSANNVKTTNPVSYSSNPLVNDVLITLSDMVGVFIGMVFITIGLIVLIQSNEKVRDAQRKVLGAAAAVNPELAGAAVATNVLTGKKPRQENVTQLLRNQNRKTRLRKADMLKKQRTAENYRVAAEAAAANKPKPKPISPEATARNKATLSVKPDAVLPSKFSVPSSPRIERPD